MLHLAKYSFPAHLHAPTAVSSTAIATRTGGYQGGNVTQTIVTRGKLRLAKAAAGAGPTGASASVESSQSRRVMRA